MKIKTGNFRIPLYNPFLIFSLSILACLFVLSIERLTGIGWDFHPDANTYITISNGAVSNFDVQSYFGALFFALVDMMNSEVWMLITFNIFVYSILMTPIIIFPYWINFVGLTFLIPALMLTFYYNFNYACKN